MALTSKAVFYYSMTGNTKALIESCDTTGYAVFDLYEMALQEVDFRPYQTILLGTSTIGDGFPHDIFKKLTAQLAGMNRKRIGLFGSGNSIYPRYCGALDILEDFLRTRNEILFKFKFEGYPKRQVMEQFQQLLRDIS
ncbi:flavodoxin family protein [Brevibacillus fulvus]|uniref:Flavodoxin I n=1 Tax=Brevibacillus fulvus TaxID=1125967 RepID=A0A938XVV0_9BACL|nr:flavodoxin I [Brevibacillus fulvus]